MQYKNTSLYKKVIDLTDITELAFEKLYSSAIVEPVKKGKNLLNLGEICKNVFFIESGYLRVFIENDGVEINTDFVFENNFVTNLKSLRLSVPSDTIIQAGENSIIYKFDKEKLSELYKEFPEFESFSVMMCLIHKQIG